MPGGCAIDGCAGELYARGLCRSHGWRLRNNKTPGVEAIRFWAMVDRSGGPEACWPWTGPTVRGGYGLWAVVVDGKHTTTVAHRRAWELTKGRIPDGLLVRHVECDNPPCCNSAHHSLGTQADNMNDAFTKGRPTGQAARKAKISR